MTESNRKVLHPAGHWPTTVSGVNFSAAICIHLGTAIKKPSGRTGNGTEGLSGCRAEEHRQDM